MLSFHLTLHAKGNGATPGPVVELTSQAGAKNDRDDAGDVGGGYGGAVWNFV